ncbi:MAG TPA: hypothetical protein VFH61_14380, partial [Thermoleophilia bacterium]|nr:hypothetical protein [Thermoleophilia bacterium]
GYVVDQEAMRALAEAVGADPEDFRSTRIPVQVLANLEVVPDAVTGDPRMEVPEAILRTRMAYYWGSRCQCASEKFVLKNKEVCARDGIDFPPNPDSIASWIGRARTRTYDDKHRLIAEHRRGCNPLRCQFATGKADTHTPPRPLCKPQTIFCCQLPFMPRLGVAAKFVTTSWQSTALLRSSLLLIGAQNQGWLAMLPLELVMEVVRVSSEGYTAPIVHCEFAGDMAALRAKTVELKGLLTGLDAELRALSSGAEGDVMRALDSGEEARAWSREFAHETADAKQADAPAVAAMTEGYLAGLVAEAGWTEARLQGALDAAGSDEDVVIAELEVATGRAVPEAEWEEAEAEAPPPEEENPAAALLNEARDGFECPECHETYRTQEAAFACCPDLSDAESEEQEDEEDEGRAWTGAPEDDPFGPDVAGTGKASRLFEQED